MIRELAVPVNDYLDARTPSWEPYERAGLIAYRVPLQWSAEMFHPCIVIDPTCPVADYFRRA